MRRLLFALVVMALAGPARAQGQQAWVAPREPVRIFGNTYYVGSQGLSAILVTSDQGHVLIDAPMGQNAGMIAANIRTLGFRLGDVRLILNSHAHPEASQLWERIGRRDRGGDATALVDTAACRRYADAGRTRLQRRLDTERNAQ